MVAIGRALMARPKMILLDEPSLGLSPKLVKEIFEIIVRINRENGTTIILVEQNANVALQIAHHGYILELGRHRHGRYRGGPVAEGRRQGVLSGHQGQGRARRPPMEEAEDMAMTRANAQTGESRRST